MLAGSARPWTKILVVITEDWFALSHFVPLLAELKVLADRVVVAARPSGRLEEIGALGVEVRPFDMQRGSLSLSRIRRVREDLARLIEAERPDAIHAIAVQPMVMASLALARSGYRPAAVILHLTGRGYLAYARSPLAHLLRAFAHAALRRCVRRCNAWVVGENADDVAEMIVARVANPKRTAIVPGAGVDPARYPRLPEPGNAVPRIAYVGRMLRSKGVHVLVEAHRLLRKRGVAAELALFGDADLGNREAIPRQELARWNAQPGVTWYGRIADVVAVWRHSDIAVVPSLGGDGMPRAMLEAAACGRPLVVSDVPGCRQFVRPGMEGLVVPPGDAHALAGALAVMASDARVRLQAGAAARRRLVTEYTEAAVRARTSALYLACRHQVLPA